ncbi:MAG: branched-chain amino acid ABC transporter substrate-binding protein [Proteobacteria bacterium]|nr:branched-chain amino acid ABC transporter substrate-binding protein [Pseudomonadota bacterium]MBI3496018.1 branched-chain amino acid ABC transporter substrate-binding protein [Pseudomonadota bacterium]
MRRWTSSLLAAAAVAAFTAAPAKAQDILIATVGPMTGQYAAFGEQMKRGADMAIADINAKGGVLGRKVTIQIGDDACDPKQAVAVANQLVGRKVAFVAGHFCSSSSIPASAIYNEADVLQMTPASTNPALTDGAAEKGWQNVLRSCGRDDAQGLVAGKWLAQQYKAKKVAIIHDKSAYGKGLADETKKAMNAAGLQEAMYEAITQGDKDFSAVISKMKAGGIDVMYLGGYHTEAGLLVRQAREQGFNALLVSGDALVTDEFWKITGNAGQGTLMTFPPDPRKLSTAKDVVAKFKAQNYDPEGYTLYTYAAIQAWAAAATATKSLKTADLAKWFRSNKVNTVIGPIEWDKKGDIKNASYVWYIFKEGKYAEM